MAEKKWFEEWFDSPYYHVLYSNRNDAEAARFIEKITAYLHFTPETRVLDVACGKGRHSKTLACLGYDVTGIDLSCNSITEAKKFETPRLQFAVWDMRNVFKPEAFDAVFNLFSSFGYFDDDAEDAKAIAAMHADLKPGGILVMDYLNTEYVVKMMKPREIIEREGIQFHISKRLEGGFIKKKIEFLVNGEDHNYEEQVKMINKLRFETMLTNAGFTLLETFGDYELNKFESGTSARLIMVAKKNG